MCMSVCVLLISEPTLQEMVGLIRLVDCRLPALKHEIWRGEGVSLEQVTGQTDRQPLEEEEQSQ